MSGFIVGYWNVMRLDHKSGLSKNISKTQSK